MTNETNGTGDWLINVSFVAHDSTSDTIYVRYEPNTSTNTVEIVQPKPLRKPKPKRKVKRLITLED